MLGRTARGTIRIDYRGEVRASAGADGSGTIMWVKGPRHTSGPTVPVPRVPKVVYAGVRNRRCCPGRSCLAPGLAPAGATLVAPGWASLAH